MERVALGRTGLKVSQMGLGAGGHSRVGASTGRTEGESVALVREALDRGVTFIDTAEAYGTEEIVGKAIRGLDRTSFIISTKKSTNPRISVGDLETSLEGSLKRLGTDFVDIYHLHAVSPGEYDYLAAEIVPALVRMREKGKIRFLGITESFGADAGHAMLQRALRDRVWDVMMVGFNILNQSARERVLPTASMERIGILVMFAVRRALHDPEKLRETVRKLIAEGSVDPNEVDADDPLGFLVREGSAASIVDAAYRFCRFEPGTHVILSGTGNAEHLRENLRSFERPPLPEEDARRLAEIFRNVDSVTGS